jgi:hypothetical protein
VSAAFIAAAGITVLAVFLFIAESQSLSEGHARIRTQLLNAARWAFVIALDWVLIPAALSQPGPERAATIIGLMVLIGALILVPLGWLIRMGGRRGNWELRRVKLEVARLSNRVRHGRGSVSQARLEEAVDRVRYLRTPATAELCDLMVAELNDLIAGQESWNEGGRRSIRIDELARELWSEEMPPPDNDPSEATFRWYIYRTFGRMMEIGGGEPTPEAQAEFRKLMDTLEECRRPDTNTLLDAVQRSAEAWIANPAAGRPWIASYDFEELGPAGLEEIRWIWGREAAMWGAHLDEDDLRALKEDLAKREASAEAASDPAPEQAQEAEARAKAV